MLHNITLVTQKNHADIPGIPNISEIANYSDIANNSDLANQKLSCYAMQ